MAHKIDRSTYQLTYFCPIWKSAFTLFIIAIYNTQFNFFLHIYLNVRYVGRYNILLPYNYTSIIPHHTTPYMENYHNGKFKLKIGGRYQNEPKNIDKFFKFKASVPSFSKSWDTIRVLQWPICTFHGIGTVRICGQLYLPIW